VSLPAGAEPRIHPDQVWFGQTHAAYNENPSDVAVNWLGNLDFTRVTVRD